MLRSLVGVLSVPVLASGQCSYAHSDPAATFDLTGLTNQLADYEAPDTYVKSHVGQLRPFYYYFNLCKAAVSPTAREDPDLCAVAGDSMGAIGAYQVVNGTQYNNFQKSCNVLGVTEQRSFKLIDDVNSNAAVGVQMRYEGGSSCLDNSNVKRSFSINVRCVKEVTTLDFISTVSESLENLCEYEVDIFSIYGCPMECHSTTHDKLCSGHGTCAIDSESRRARCFCNGGWGGQDCGEAVASSSGPSASSVNSSLTVVVVILLILLLGLSYVLYGKIKALNADDNPYSTFDDQNMPHAATDM